MDLYSRIPPEERWVLPSDLRQFGSDEHAAVLRKRDPEKHGLNGTTVAATVEEHKRNRPTIAPPSA